MITVDLRKKDLSIAELLRIAKTQVVRILDTEGHEFVLEVADEFDREVAQLGQSEKFMSFLSERANEPGGVTLEALERKLNGA